MAQRHVPWPNATTASQSLVVVGAAIVTPTTATQGPPTVVMPSRTLSSPPFTSTGGATGGWGRGGRGESGQSTELEPYTFIFFSPSLHIDWGFAFSTNITVVAYFHSDSAPRLLLETGSLEIFLD